MCNPNEDPSICGLKIERNNIADEDAIYRGQVERDKLKAATLAQWWKEYAILTDRKRKTLSEYWASYDHAVPNLHELNRHIANVCRNPALSQSTLSLCSWWKRNR